MNLRAKIYAVNLNSYRIAFDLISLNDFKNSENDISATGLLVLFIHPIIEMDF